MRELAGRTAFITGGAQGIGLGIARACAEAGMKVAIADNDAPKLREAESELSAKSDLIARWLDVRDRAAFTAVADEVEATLGPVALLCNNAGTGVQTPVGAMSYQAWDFVMGVNLNGVYNGVQTFVPRMSSRAQPAYIVNTASGGGLVANPGFLYAASKYGVVGLSESLRTELPPLGIGVSVLCPGPVATDIVRNTLASAPKRPDGRPVTDGVENYFGYMQQVLATVGRPVDEVGKLVLDAVRAGRFWILTDDTAVSPLRRRTEEIIAATPEGTFVTITPEMINDIPAPVSEAPPDLPDRRHRARALAECPGQGTEKGRALGYCPAGDDGRPVAIRDDGPRCRSGPRPPAGSA